MARIEPLDPKNAQGNAKDLLDGVAKKFGRVPNIMATMAKSPAVLGAYLAFGQAMGGAKLPAALREQIALTVAGANGCDYCASAHGALAAKLGVAEQERLTNLQGASDEEKTSVALAFARKIVENRGWLEDEDLEAVRRAGYDDAEILEIIATVAINVFTNYFNHIVQTEVDFPLVRTATSASR